MLWMRNGSTLLYLINKPSVPGRQSYNDHDYRRGLSILSKEGVCYAYGRLYLNCH